jgi:hypothetical protein
MKMHDKHGTPVFPRDLMASCDGGSYCSEGYFTHINLWEVPDSCDGSGIWYTSEGKPTSFWWGNVQKSTKLYKAKLPDGFYLAFRHGMHSVYADEKLCKTDIYEALKQSNWQGTLTPDAEKRTKATEEQSRRIQ